MRRINKPLVRIDLLVIDDADTSHVNPIQVGSHAWYTWLTDQSGFVYEGSAGNFTARREFRRGISYWYAYRRRDGKLRKLYLGKNEDLTQEHLERASAFLAGQVPWQSLVVGSNSTDLITNLNPRPHITSSSARTMEEIPLPPLTKIKPPPLPQKLLSRPQLTCRINAHVTVIYAPSGFGTSTLLNEWQQNCGIPVAWVSLDADDNQPLHFWSTVITALQTLNPSLGQNWRSQLRASSPFALSTLVVNLKNDITQFADSANSSKRIGLVLDNYHFIRNSEIHTSLQTWLEHMPSALNLVIAGHTQPPLALGYLRSKGMVTELEAADIRFSLEEAIEYMVQNTPEPILAYSQMQTLYNRTEGWVTGLVLAIPVLNQEWDRSKFKSNYTGAQPLLQEFFKENVLDQLPLDTQTFLIKTSILKKLTGPLCDAVTGFTDSAKILTRLLERNYFIERLDKPGWYRYNNMFSEVLSVQLQERFPTEIQGLHHEAAQWYCAQNSKVDAIYHLLASNSWEEAAAFIEQVASNELERVGEDSRLLDWLLQLPEQVIQKHDLLLTLYLRLAGISLPPSEVDDFLIRIEKNLSSVPQTSKGEIVQDEIRQFRKIWAKKSESVAEISSNGEQDLFKQTLDGILRSYRDYRYDIVQAEIIANKVYEMALAKNNPYGILMAGGGCASLALSQGQLRRSEKVAQEVLRQVFALCGRFPESASIPLTALSEVYFLRDQLPQAHQFLVRATEVNPNPTSSNEAVSMAILRAKIQSAQGDNVAAFTTIQAVREVHHLRHSSLWLDQDLIAYLELFRLRVGDLDTTDLLPIDRGDINNSVFSALVQAEILIEKKRSTAAEDILNNLLSRYPHGAYMFPVLRVRVILAIALFDQGKINQARQVMAESARLAAPEYFLRPFIDYGPKIGSLLSLVLHTENLNSRVQSFLRGTLTILDHGSGVQRILPHEESNSLSIAASISPREQEILRFLSTGLSNREIASRCSISTSTVKTHIENIYLKLGVNSRLQAIAQAQMLNLV